MPLDTYRRKRSFEETPEPAGTVRRSAVGRLFVVQKHAASHLHYDFRLELDGVLVSWAVPKGPSYDPSERRLAVHVEDHPLDYADFEGVIPKGQYGGGTVMLWDRGEWTVQDEAQKGLAKGQLKFFLDGEKLRGGWTLVRMGGRSNEDGKENWLLIKERDGTERDASAPDVTEEESARSVASGRTMDEIARDRDRVWHSPEAGVDEERLEELPERRLPAVGSLKAELATLVDEPPSGDAWLHEIKFDGYRLFGVLSGGNVKLVTRGGKDWTERFPDTEAAVRELPAHDAVLDGEVVVLDESGVSDFQRLQNALDRPGSGLIYYVFDLLHLDGRDVSSLPLEERKALLEELVGSASGTAAGRIRYSDHVRGNGEAFYREACEHGLEGIVSKRADRAYSGGRGRDWLKTKCLLEQEFVIVGYTDPSGSRTGLGALLVGYQAEGGLTLAGKVGTGFDERTLRELTGRLEPMRRKTAPVVNPPRGAAARGVHWVRPELLAQVAFTEWTKDGSLRHPSFKGLREDKSPSEVVREEPQDPEDAAVAGQEEPVNEDEATSHFTIPDLSGVRVRLTSPDRVLYREQGLTKGELAAYYALVSERMLPFLADRPLTLVRCPAGTEGDCFYQKHAAESVPEAVKRIPIQEQRKTAEYLYVDSVEGLVSLVQIGVLEIHAWGARIDRLERPDLLVMDLDPGPNVQWSAVVEAAVALRDRLEGLGLRTFPKSTGGKGVHVVAPLVRRSDWDELKGFARALAAEMAGRWPDRYTDTASKAEREGRIYVDYLRNARGATAILPYSTRARDGAPVAVPITWRELEASDEPIRYTVRSLPDRLRRLRRDPWEGYGSVRQSITVGMKKELGVGRG